jgi:UDP:flavonoid glycosyltransferase YjiC (YdhE family)
MTPARRILFIAENITLAQVVRLVTLAKKLDRAKYEVHFACSEFSPLVFAGTQFRTWLIRSVNTQKALEKVGRGEWIYDESVLDGYVDDELALISQVKPDFIIGDFRLSLAVSAPLSQVPYAALINAYWSPYAVRDGFPIPDHPIVRLVGLKRATRFFPQALPLVFKHFASPINNLRRHRGLPPIGSLLEVLTYGDYALYPDVPELCPTTNLPGHHRYLGFVPWSPNVTLPDELASHDPELPLIYVTLGSSGNLNTLGAVLAAVSAMPVRVLLATARRRLPVEVPGNVCVADFVPGDVVARSATVVVTNGGSSTGYQALAAGTPVLGLPSNLDQYLAMTAVERQGAGLLLRAASATIDEVRAALDALIQSTAIRGQARHIASIFAQYDCHAQLAGLLTRALD